MKFRTGVALGMVLSVLVTVAFWGTIIAVVYHFVLKLW